jgi:hypothetical protein
MIYIPTLTSKLKYETREYENILYSPNIKLNKVVLGKNITIWDNYTYYLRFKYNKPDKHIVAKNHYLWLINFIKNNYIDGVTLITPDIEWLQDKEEIMEKWYNNCREYPQLYVPETWNNLDLNIVGYALRINSPDYIHPNWNHCLRHKRELNCKLLTYDSIIER